jgi:hypothetical protein
MELLVFGKQLNILQARTPAMAGKIKTIYIKKAALVRQLFYCGCL